MNKGVLAIYDLDVEYANCLMSYISDKKGLPLKTIVFTEMDALLNYTEGDYIDILLIAASAMNHQLEERNIGKIILLSAGNIFSEYIGYSSIFKYQSSENIIREVLDYYVDVHKSDGMIEISKGNTEIIGIYSPVGRVGKTTFALTLGQVLAQEHTVLYINMEEFSAFDKIFNKTYGGDLSDLMYFYKQNKEALPIKLQAIVNNLHGLNYIPPLIYSADLRNLDTKEWIEMIWHIASEGTYDKIILDMGSVIKDVFRMMDICNKIYMPIDDDLISLMKVAAFEEYVLKSDKGDILNRITKIKIPQGDTVLDDEEYYERQVWGTVGDFIRVILNDED